MSKTSFVGTAAYYTSRAKRPNKECGMSTSGILRKQFFEKSPIRIHADLNDNGVLNEGMMA